MVSDYFSLAGKHFDFVLPVQMDGCYKMWDQTFLEIRVISWSQTCNHTEQPCLSCNFHIHAQNCPHKCTLYHECVSNTTKHLFPRSRSLLATTWPGMGILNNQACSNVLINHLLDLNETSHRWHVQVPS